MSRTIRRTLLGALLVGALGLLPTTAGAATTPIKIMLTVPVNSPTYAYPEVVPTMQAGVRMINKQGGINGVPISMEVCDNGLNVNKAQQCAQKAVQDKVVAFVGTYVQIAAGGLYPTIEAAKIPNIPISPSTPLDWASKVDFPIVGDPFSYVGAVMLGLGKAGCKNVSILGYSDAAYTVYQAITQKAAQTAKIKSFRVRVPITTTDWTSAVQQVIQNGSDCIQLHTAGGALPGIVRAVRASGKKIRLGMNQPNIDPNLKTLGKYLEGALAAGVSVDPTLSPAANAPKLMKEYAKAMKDGGVNDRKQASTTAFSAWLGLQLFKQAATAIPKGKVTSASLIAQLNKTKWNPTGISGGTDFTKGGPLIGADRLKNFQFYIKQVVNGKLKLRKDGVVNLASTFKGFDYTKAT